MGDITFTAATRFDANMRMELQQKESKLYSKLQKRDVAGAEKTKIDNIIASHQTRKKTERNGQVVHDETGWDGIWVAKPDPDYLATLVDQEDKLLTNVDIQGGDVMSHAGAINRAKDDAFLAGFFGSMITGKNGTTLNAFNAANTVAVDWQGPNVAATGAYGMSVVKMRHARRILTKNYVDLDQPLYVVLTGQQVEELSIDAKAANRDFTEVSMPKWSADGKYLTGLAGFEIIEMELLNPLLANGGLAVTTDGNNYLQLPFFTADGLVAAVWEELFTSVDKLPTQHFSAQVYSRCQQVVSRTDQNRCGVILCHQ